MRSWTIGAAVTMLTVFGSGCSEPSPAGPGPLSSTPVPVVPATPRTVQIIVSVTDTAFQPLADVRVEILNGPTPVESAMTTTGQALFTGQYSGTLQVRATKDGFVAASGVLDLNLQRGSTISMGLYLHPVRPSASLEADAYVLTFVAAAACTTIPEALRTRRYNATVTVSPQPGIYFLHAGGEFLRYGGLVLGIAGTYARFDDDMGFWEQLPPFVYLDLAGSGAATVEPTTLSHIEMTYDGAFRYCSLRGGRQQGCFQAPADQVIESGECFSRDHRVTLERR